MIEFQTGGSAGGTRKSDRRVAEMDRRERVESKSVVSMSTQALYDKWSATYDEVDNKTRDLEKSACESVLSDVEFESVIELGGGTGKNTTWLARRSVHLFSVELSPEMQTVAKSKTIETNVEFCLADIREDWNFVNHKVDLITCSLILEHIEDLTHVFQKSASTLKPKGWFYVCELHPFKQYIGSKARFDIEGETHILDCYRHHVSDYTSAAEDAGFSIAKLDEWFDDNDRKQIPRLISFLFKLEK
jgi:malonyl-CoA O-methyltransferase